tara:strand:+ start:1099 stop:1671 length:573 start_codon:yes stop_codon:yes gene_type:complete
MNRQPKRLLVKIAAFAWIISMTPQVMSQDAKPAPDDIDVQYFGKKLELAEHDLLTAIEANRRIPNMNTKLSMLRLENQVTYATMLFQQAGATSDHDLHKSHLQSVENDLRLAEAQLKWAEEVNSKHSGFIREDQVNRLRLSAELTRLALTRAQQPEITSDPLHHLHWQIDRLQSELLSLQVEFERVRSGQ